MTDTDKLYGKPHKQPVYGKSYIDTDKLKRLAEAVDLDHVSGIYMDGELVKYRDTFLALIAENERLDKYSTTVLREKIKAEHERDEAVALLRDSWKFARARVRDVDDIPTRLCGDIISFLCRMDNAKNA